MEWLKLQEYAYKHQVSVSTLRRRIKTASIEFTFKNGKYLILDKPEDFNKRIQASEGIKELKETYYKILKQKDEQILKLSYELEDLKKLVALLEQGNSKNT